MLKESEAIVLRSYPMREADLLVSFFTRAEGKVKGVARAAKKSKRRFGGALEPLTHVRLYWEDRERTDLARIDSCEILLSPLSETIDYPRAVALAHIAELLDELLPDRQHDDAIFRLTLAVLPHIHASNRMVGPSNHRIIKERRSQLPARPMSRSSDAPSSIWLPITYFDLWLARLTGLLPSLTECSSCGAELNGHRAFFHPMAEGLLCARDKRLASIEVSLESRSLAAQVFKASIAELLGAEPPTTDDRPDASGPTSYRDLRKLLTHVFERHIEKNLVTSTMLDRLNN